MHIRAKTHPDGIRDAPEKEKKSSASCTCPALFWGVVPPARGRVQPSPWRQGTGTAAATENTGSSDCGLLISLSPAMGANRRGLLVFGGGQVRNRKKTRLKKPLVAVEWLICFAELLRRHRSLNRVGDDVDYWRQPGGDLP